MRTPNDPDAPEVTVTVLAYNEAQNLEPVVRELVAELERTGRSWELLLVDDGSSDGTGELADSLAARDARLRVVHHGVNKGLGGGYRTGFRQARGQWLTFFPADGQFPATILRDFLAQSEHVDMVLGYLPARPDPIAKLLSLAERVLYRALFGKMPRFQGIMLFRRRLLDELPLVSDGRGWAVVMELILRASRGPYRLVSVPTTVRPRMSGESKVNNLKTIRANLEQLLTLRGKL